MKLDTYYNDLPLDFDLTGKVDELKLVTLFAYNAFYNADPLYTEEVKDHICFNRKNEFGIDGVFLNTTLEENTIELVYSYHVGQGIFAPQKALNAIDHMRAHLDDAVHAHYVNHNSKADDLLKESLSQFEKGKKVVILRVITDAVPDEEQRFAWTKLIENYDVKVKECEVNACVIFADDIIASVGGNKAPFDYVEMDKLVMDNPTNILTYGDNSFICNISAKSLKALWDKEGKRGLLAMNLRYYVKNKNIDQKIEDSLTYDYKDFWYLNNGIIVVCDEYNIVDNELRMEHFSIVNGGQTTKMIGTIPFENDFFISCKVIKNTFTNSNDKNQFIAKVAEATNTQKPIKAKDIIANKIEQRNLKSQMQENNIFIEIKRGEQFNHDIYKEPWQRTKNNELAQDLYSFVFMEPGPARNNVSTILQSEEKYDKIFVDHKYSSEFLRDVIILEKAFKEFAKVTSKDDEVDAVRKGLVKNGLFYTLATIGYLCKLAYNPEYRSDVMKYRNNDGLYGIYSPEKAFDHSFLPTNNYKIFVARAAMLFEFVFTNMIVPQFQSDKANNPSLVYSNWTKTNTGFNAIRRTINAKLFDVKDEMWLDFIKSFFKSISDDQKNKNIDDYVDLCKKHKVESKSSTGEVLTLADEALRNELLNWRLQKAKQVHMYDEKIFKLECLDGLVSLKPSSKAELKKIVGATSAAYFGDEMLKIITKYI